MCVYSMQEVANVLHVYMCVIVCVYVDLCVLYTHACMPSKQCVCVCV